MLRQDDAREGVRENINTNLRQIEHLDGTQIHFACLIFILRIQNPEL